MEYRFGNLQIYQKFLSQKLYPRLSKVITTTVIKKQQNTRRKMTIIRNGIANLDHFPLMESKWKMLIAASDVDDLICLNWLAP